MRLLLTLHHRRNQVLPINYQYLISAWVYQTLSNADEKYATQLHQHGYDFGGKQYKLFTFSGLHPRWFDINKKAKTFILSQAPTRLELSFHIDEAIQHFVIGLFKDQQFSLSSGSFHADFEVSGIQILPKPVFHNSMQFRLMTPLCISRKVEGTKHAVFQSPENEGYVELLLKNLLRKQQATFQQTVGVAQNTVEIDFPYSFELLTKPKSKLFTIKGIQIRGFLFDFEIRAPAELLTLGFFAGFGEKNSSLGMGMVMVLK